LNYIQKLIFLSPIAKLRSKEPLNGRY